MGELPGLARDEVLGDDPRLRSLAALEIRVGEVRLRLVHDRLEPAVDADLDQLQQRLDLPGHAGDEFLEHRRGIHVVAGRELGVDRRVDAHEGRFRRHRRQRPGEIDDLGAQVDVNAQQLRENLARLVHPAVAQRDLHQRHEQGGILAGDRPIEVGLRALEIPGRDRGSRQLGPSLHVVGIQPDRLAQRRQGLRDTPLLGMVGVHRAVLRRGGDVVAVGFERACAASARASKSAGSSEPSRIDDLVSAGAIAARFPLGGDRHEVGLGVGEQPLLGRDLGQVQLHRLLVRLDLEDLLVERGRLRKEAFGIEVIGDLGVLRHRLVGLAGADVEVPERVARVPVAGLFLDQPGVLGDRQIELALPEQLLGFLDRFCAVDGQGS